MRRLSKVIAAVACLIVAIGVALAWYGWATRAAAEVLLGDITKLTVGKSTEADAEQFYREHKRFLASRICERDYCVTSFKIQNRWLSVLRLEPPAEFHADFTVRDGKVTRIGAMLARSMPIYPTFSASAGFVDEYAEFPPHMAAKEAHYVFPTPVGKPYLRVALDSRASAVDRKHAFAFSFRCLVKPGWGCDLPCDYLPLAWQDWKAELRDSGYPMNGFYPKDARCTR